MRRFVRYIFLIVNLNNVGKKLLSPNAYPDQVNKNKRRKCDAPEREIQAMDPRVCLQQTITRPNASSVDGEMSYGGDNLDNSWYEMEQEVDNIQTMKELRQRLKATLAKGREYKRKLQEKSSAKLEKIFNEDQLAYLEKHNTRESSWSEDTFTKALRYAEIRKQNLPYPSIRTLQHRIRNLKFKPGILDKVFGMLKMKVKTFDPQEKHATLMLDEMTITPGLQYDNTLSMVVSRPTMKSSGGIENSNELAIHALQTPQL